VLRIVAMVVSAVAVVAAISVLALFLWLRTYDPLDAAYPVTPGPGLGASIEPTLGSGGKPVFVPAYRRGRQFEMTLTLANHGRFAVTLLGLGRNADGPVTPESVTRNLRLDPKQTSLVTVTWKLTCPKGVQQAYSDRVRLRYRYLSLFTKTASVELPFAVTLRCREGPPPTP
jgi:hypothetical protein